MCTVFQVVSLLVLQVSSFLFLFANLFAVFNFSWRYGESTQINPLTCLWGKAWLVNWPLYTWTVTWYRNALPDSKNLTGTRQTKEMLFLCLIPVRFMLLTKTFLYHVTDQLQGFVSPNVDWVSGWRGGRGEVGVKQIHHRPVCRWVVAIVGKKIKVKFPEHVKSDPAVRCWYWVIGLAQHILKWNQLHALGQQLMSHAVHFK